MRSVNSFWSFQYIIPLLLLGTLTSPQAPFQRVDDEKTWKIRRYLSHCLLSTAILSRWQQPVASVVALDLLYQAMPVVLYRHKGMAINTASKVYLFLNCCLFACCPGGPWGDTERVVAQCWRPVASGVALDMPHWVMSYVLLRRTAVAFEMAGR